MQIDATGIVSQTLAQAGPEKRMKLATQAIAQWRFPALPAQSTQGTRTGQVIFKLLLHDNNVWLALQGRGEVLVISAVPLEKQGKLSKPKDRFPFTATDIGPEDCPVSTEEKAGKAHGSVQVQILVSEEGKVLAARAILGHPLLHDASVQAALQWKFKPTLTKGIPVKVEGILTFNYKLEQPEKP